MTFYGRSKSQLSSNYKLDFFYIYILGNVLSLLVVLALGLVGRIVAAYVKDLIGC
jgi:hypothetical protein